MQEGENEQKAASSDPDALAKLMELELLQKRAVWQRASANRSTFRTASLFFVFIVVMMALLGLFYVLTMVDRPKGDRGRKAPTESADHP